MYVFALHEITTAFGTITLVYFPALFSEPYLVPLSFVGWTEQRRGGGMYLYQTSPIDKVNEHDSMPWLLPVRNCFMSLAVTMAM